MDNPLAPEGDPLSVAERTRYARHLLLPGVGQAGQQRLRSSRVLLVGAGGLGSPVALYLAAAGVGTLVVVDDDTVDLTNLQRQIVHGHADVGRAKVESAAEAIARVSPDTEVITHPVRFGSATALDLVADVDLVIDGADNFPTRGVVSRACVVLGTPHVWGSVYRFDAQVSVWWPPAGPCYHCVFPTPPPIALAPSCSTGGVLGATVGAVGSVMAAEAIKLLCGLGDPLVGRLLVHDTLAQSWDTLTVRANPQCVVCGAGAEPFAVGRQWAQPPARASRPTGSRASRPTVSVHDLAAALSATSAEAGAPVLIDVRESGEREIVQIAGSWHVPLADIRAGVEAVPTDVPVYVVCKSGTRSAEAVDLLRARGVDAIDVAGGVLAWVATIEPDLATY